ncbi:MAG: FG-GAP repeat protein [Verrucomicrobiae bacterium]|nr:FG-GAP repeat protein [Verrucomicrobiae bacterium]
MLSGTLRSEVQVMEGTRSDAAFGACVTSAGDVNGDGYGDFVVGAPDENERRGRVFVYYGSTNGSRAAADWQYAGEQREEYFGKTCAGVGDINGDGFDDLLIGSSLPDNGASGRGRVYLFYGSSGGLSASPDWTYSDQHPGETLGNCVAPAGDVNHDGFRDVLVCSTAVFDPTVLGDTPTSFGHVFVFHGSPAGLNPQPDWQVAGEAANERYLGAASWAGDVNGDQYDDVIISAPYYHERFKREGKVWVYHGSAQGLEKTPAWSAVYEPEGSVGPGLRGSQLFGNCVGRAGDVNRDGFDDVFVGAYFAEHGDVDEGLVFVYHGSARGLSPNFDWFGEGNQKLAQFGAFASGGWDLNRDGYDDLIVGVPKATHTDQLSAGAAAVFHGSPQGLSKTPDWSADGQQNFNFFGLCVALVRDVNGDGFADALVGSPGSQRHGDKIGRAYLYYGSPQGLPDSSSWRWQKTTLGLLRERLAEMKPGQIRTLVAVLGIVLLGAALLARHLWVKQRARRAASSNPQFVLARERQRISRDIHDDLGSRLAQIALITDLTQQDRADPQKIEAHLQKLSQVARGAAGALRENIWALDAENDPLDELAGYLCRHTEQFLAGTGIRLHLDLPPKLPELPVSGAVRKSCFLAFKEALTNAVKHSNCSEIRIQFELQGPELVIHIADNGRGFDWVDQAPSDDFHHGNGLCNMADRMREAGGHCELASRPGQGTQVRLAIPLDSATEPVHEQNQGLPRG